MTERARPARKEWGAKNGLRRACKAVRGQPAQMPSQLAGARCFGLGHEKSAARIRATDERSCCWQEEEDGGAPLAGLARKLAQGLVAKFWKGPASRKGEEAG